MSVILNTAIKVGLKSYLTCKYCIGMILARTYVTISLVELESPSSIYGNAKTVNPHSQRQKKESSIRLNSEHQSIRRQSSLLTPTFYVTNATNFYTPHTPPTSQTTKQVSIRIR